MTLDEAPTFVRASGRCIMYPQTMASLRRTDPARSARPARLGEPVMPARPCSDGDGLRWMLCARAIFCRRFATTSAPFVGALQSIVSPCSNPWPLLIVIPPPLSYTSAHCELKLQYKHPAFLSTGHIA